MEIVGYMRHDGATGYSFCPEHAQEQPGWGKHLPNHDTNRLWPIGDDDREKLYCHCGKPLTKRARDVEQ